MNKFPWRKISPNERSVALRRQPAKALVILALGPIFSRNTGQGTEWRSIYSAFCKCAPASLVRPC